MLLVFARFSRFAEATLKSSSTSRSSFDEDRSVPSSIEGAEYFSENGASPVPLLDVNKLPRTFSSLESRILLLCFFTVRK